MKRAPSNVSKFIKSKRKKISFHFVTCMLILSLAVITYIMYQCGILESFCGKIINVTGLQDYREASIDYPLSVHFIDVGCGDSILIKADDKNLLIDTGCYSLNGDTSEYLKNVGVTHIDLFIASHTDSDHIGDFSSVANHFPINKIWLSDFCQKRETEWSEDEKIFYQTISKLHIKVDSPETGIYDFGTFTIEVLSPTEKSKNDNDNSLVLRLDYGDASFLFTGDTGKKIEKQLLREHKNIKTDILKAGHHGSNTSSTQEFLKEAAPSYTVISAGTENKFLPNRFCIDRINDCGSKILRTDLNGSIIFVYDGKELSYLTEYEH